MQQAIIDCKTGNVTYVDLSPEQEAKRLEEIAVEHGRQVAEEKKVARREIARKLAELREMRQNKDVFSDSDIAQMQAEIDKLKESL